MNEPEWRDANPETEDLPNKGKTAILLIAGGVALFVLAKVGMVIKPIGLAAGTFAFISGLGMIIRSRKAKANFKTGLIISIAGFLILLSTPRFGTVTAAIAGTALSIGSVGLVVFGIFKALKISWDLSKRS